MRSDLSEFANSVYDQVWIKRGRPEKIQIVELDLKCSQSNYLKSIIFGNPGEARVDGVHLRGKSAARHFTYRAIQAIKPIIKNPFCELDCPQQRYQRGISANHRAGFEVKASANQRPAFDNQPWQFSQGERNGKGQNYAEVVKKGNTNKQAGANQGVPTYNSVPVYNQFEVLGN